MAIRPYSDYHWYRQVAGENGQWVHKRGAGLTDYLDDNEDPIYDPEIAVVGNYTIFLGSFAFKHRTVSVSNVAVVQDLLSLVSASQAVVDYNVKDDILLTDFNEFTIGVSTLDEVKAVVGAEHDYTGYGHIADVYYTSDGYVVLVYYSMTNYSYVVSRILIMDQGAFLDGRQVLLD